METNRFESFLHAWHVGGRRRLPHAGRRHLDHPRAWAVSRSRSGSTARAPPARIRCPLASWRWSRLDALWNRLYYIDDFYLWLVKKVQQGIAHVAWWFERNVIIGAVMNGISYLVKWTGDKVRRVQTGSLSGYVTAFTFGLVLLAAITLLASCGAQN